MILCASILSNKSLMEEATKCLFHHHHHHHYHQVQKQLNPTHLCQSTSLGSTSRVDLFQQLLSTTVAYTVWPVCFLSRWTCRVELTDWTYLCWVQLCWVHCSADCWKLSILALLLTLMYLVYVYLHCLKKKLCIFVSVRTSSNFHKFS